MKTKIDGELIGYALTDLKWAVHAMMLGLEAEKDTLGMGSMATVEKRIEQIIEEFDIDPESSEEAE